MNVDYQKIWRELYKPFIIRKLIERGIVKTVKSGKRIIDNRELCCLGYLRKCNERTSCFIK